MEKYRNYLATKVYIYIYVYHLLLLVCSKRVIDIYQCYKTCFFRKVLYLF